jgi:hypothetical protein
MKTKTVINWSASGRVAMTSRGWMIVRDEFQGVTKWDVHDDSDRLVGRYSSQADAEAAAR